MRRGEVPIGGQGAALLCLAVLATLYGAGAAAADDCVALGGVVAAAECRIAAPVTASGAFTLDTTLHVLGTGQIVVPVPPAPAPRPTLSLTIAGGVVLDPPLLPGGGSIVGDAALAGPNPQGRGATLALTAVGDIDLRGDGVTGGAISAGGDLAACVDEGPDADHFGGHVFLTSTQGAIHVEAGAHILVNAKCRAGEIVLAAPQGDIAIEGLLEAASAAGTGGVSPRPRGGPITIVAGASLTVGLSGRISSRGLDHGADRVHLESGLDTVVLGFVQSAGGVVPEGPPNGCNLPDRPDKPLAAVACIEVWSGGALRVDATGLLTGVDLADSGESGDPRPGVCCSWIDLFARRDITILGHGVGERSAPFAVTARQFSPDAPAGIITVKSVAGKVVTTGRALQADAASAGGVGGTVVVEAASDVVLGDALVRAAGIVAGGSIAVRSFNGAITGGTGGDPGLGALDASPGGGAGIETRICTGPAYSGALVPAGTALPPACGGAPTLPAYVTLPSFQPRPVITVVGGTFVFDGQPHAATGSVVGLQGEPLGPLTFTYTDTAGATLAGPPVAVGSYTAIGAFAGDAVYRAVSASAAIAIVPDTAPTPTIVLTGTGPFVYDGAPHPATGVVVGQGGVTIAAPVFGYTDAGGAAVAAPVSAGVYAVRATYPGDAVYKPAAPVTATLTITKAPPTFVIAGGGSFTYDGNPHPATGSARGVQNAVLSPALTFTYNGGTAAPRDTAGVYAVTASFAGNANYLAATVSGTTIVLTRATPTVVVTGASVPFDGAPHGLTGTVLGVGTPPEIVMSPPLIFTYAGSAVAPTEPGVYAVVATFAGNTNYRPATGTGTLEITPATHPTEACLAVDFREITYFRDNRVITSSDAGIRARNGIPGGFDPHLWPYDPRGRGDSTPSRATLFRIYGFAENQVGVLVSDADVAGRVYPVQVDPEIPGARFVDLGGPARPIICVSQLQRDLIDESAAKKPGAPPGSTVLSDARRNVPGIMLNHNAAVIDVPRPVRDDLRTLGTPLVDDRGHEIDRGLVDYVGAQLWGHGAGRYREFVDVEIEFVFDDPDDLAAHYAFGFLTAKNVDFESFSGCNYLDTAPGNDAVRFNDVWTEKHAGDPNYGPACGTREPARNQRVRENDVVPFGAIQLLPSVNTGDDTVRLFFGAVRPAPR